MKTLLKTLIFALVLMSAQMAHAQLKFGLKGGVNVTHMSLSADVLDKSNNAGFYIGPTVYFKIPIVGLGLDASVLYDQRSADVTVEKGYEEITDESTSIRQKQIAIPINVRYSFGLGDAASLFLFAGPQFGFNVGSDIDDINWKWKDSNISVNVGAGLMLMSHLQLNVNYNVECGKTGEATASEVARNAFSGKEHAWQLGLAYYF